MLSNQQIQNNWPTIKSQVLSKWNKLSEAEVERTHGKSQLLGRLVHSKYGNNEEFDRTFEKICKISIPSSRNTSTEESSKLFHTGSPERRKNLNYTKVEKTDELNREADDELSHYSMGHRSFKVNDDDSIQFNKLHINEPNTHFSAPDEFYTSQDPGPSREDINLGRNTSSATKISTAKAASISSEASNDAKKKI
jgi:hypothetical protein